MIHYYQNKIPEIDKAFGRGRKIGVCGAATIVTLASHHHQTAKIPTRYFFASYDEFITNKVF